MSKGNSALYCSRKFHMNEVSDNAESALFGLSTSDPHGFKISDWPSLYDEGCELKAWERGIEIAIYEVRYQFAFNFNTSHARRIFAKHSVTSLSSLIDQQFG